MIHFATSTERDTTPVIEDEEDSRLDYFDTRTRSSQTSSTYYAPFLPVPIPILLDLSDDEDEDDDEEEGGDVDGQALDHISDVYMEDEGDEEEEEVEDAPTERDPTPPPPPPPTQRTRPNIRPARSTRLASTASSSSVTTKVSSACQNITRATRRELC